MKPTAILINTARGPIVDDRALYRALSEGWIAGAGLDDIEEEPAKGRDWIRTVRRFAAEEVVRVLSGQEPLSPVNADELVAARSSRSP